ncbi:restriction endonuclease subunit S [Pleomorphomonas sp. JP5]|uniref:restriction endonuclease subunit S n=1 Tax=Pleomorphomonas sp. JP5 TaxID=2942998 RepID=UPI0020437FAA|nr:restriction endonuclease subunit S [Pleomorphomonas sp. JP5]MCM5560070.1 restriction endonuclease subunit S [Pleomorphomonas sp. JP5]
MTKRLTLLDVCEFIVDCEHKTAPLAESGYPSIRTPNVGRGRLILDGANRVDEDIYKKWTKRAVPKAGDIIIAREAPVGNVALITPGQNVCLGQRTVLVRPNAKKVDNAYLCYFLLGDFAQNAFRAASIGCTVPHLNMADIRNLMLPALPKLSVQTKTAGILSAYDDLIEVNQRRIAILEEMARRLFDEWFVRFRYPGHEHVKIVDGLPEGWERRPLGEVAEVRLGKMLDAKKNRGELRPYLANVNVRWGAFDLTDLREMRVEENELAKYGLSFGDIVMCEGGEPGRCALWKAQVPEMTIQKALHRIRALDCIDPLFLYHQLYNMAKTRQLEGLFTGATIKHLPREKLIQVMIVVPPPKLIREFAALAAPLETQIGTLGDAVSRAAQARDLILPKLISGEIEVGRGEEALSRAAE